MFTSTFSNSSNTANQQQQQSKAITAAEVRKRVARLRSCLADASGASSSGRVEHKRLWEAASAVGELEPRLLQAIQNSSQPGDLLRLLDEVQQGLEAYSDVLQRPETRSPLPDTAAETARVAQAEANNGVTFDSWGPSFPTTSTPVAKGDPEDEVKRRFARLVLGEDYSGSGRGTPVAVSIANAISNLARTVFGDVPQLEPLDAERRQFWVNELTWLITPCEHIVVPKPNQVLETEQRADIRMHLPQLKRLDRELLELLDMFKSKDFSYANPPDKRKRSQRNLQVDAGSSPLPEPRVPGGGLNRSQRQRLEAARAIARRHRAAAAAINAAILAEMEVPHQYMSRLPKTAKAALGDTLYRKLTADAFISEAFASDELLESNFAAVELANKLEGALAIWQRKRHYTGSMASMSAKPLEKRIENWSRWTQRCQETLQRVRQQRPELQHTLLDRLKMQHNTDVGKAVLESYSRVLKSLANKVTTRIDDVLAIDDQARNLTFHKPTSSPRKAAPASPSFEQHSSPTSGLSFGSQTGLYRAGPSRIPSDHLVHSNNNITSSSTQPNMQTAQSVGDGPKPGETQEEFLSRHLHVAPLRDALDSPLPDNSKAIVLAADSAYPDEDVSPLVDL
eukprot:jgi/Chlat1/2719/Chrsp180S02885